MSRPDPLLLFCAALVGVSIAAVTRAGRVPVVVPREKLIGGHDASGEGVAPRLALPAPEKA